MGLYATIDTFLEKKTLAYPSWYGTDVSLKETLRIDSQVKSDATCPDSSTDRADV